LNHPAKTNGVLLSTIDLVRYGVGKTDSFQGTGVFQGFKLPKPAEEGEGNASAPSSSSDAAAVVDVNASKASVAASSSGADSSK